MTVDLLAAIGVWFVTAGGIFLAFIQMWDFIRDKSKRTKVGFLVVALSLAMAVVGVFQNLVQKTLEARRAEKEAKAELEFERLKTSTSAQIDEQKRRVKSLQTDLAQEKSRIRSLTVEVAVFFTADWKSDSLAFHNQVVVQYPENLILIELRKSKDVSAGFIQLYGTQMYNFMQSTPTEFVFYAKASVRPNDKVVGSSFESLSAIDSAQINIPLVYAHKSPEVALSVKRVSLNFRVDESKVANFEVGTGHVPFYIVKPHVPLRTAFLPIAMRGKDLRWKTK